MTVLLGSRERGMIVEDGSVRFLYTLVLDFCWVNTCAGALLFSFFLLLSVLLFLPRERRGFFGGSVEMLTSAIFCVAEHGR